MKNIFVALLVLLLPLSVMAGNTNPGGVNGQIQVNKNGYFGGVYPDALGIDAPSAFSFKKLIPPAVSNIFYTTGVTAYVSGTYTAAKGTQTFPTLLVAGQYYIVNFNQTNPTGANLQIGTLPASVIKVVDAYGNILSLVGGEIVPGPQQVYYDGTEFLYSVPVSAARNVIAAATIVQADFAAGTQFFLSAGAETLTLPCSNTLSPNGRIFVFSTSGTATIAKGSSCSDTIAKNGASATSQTIAQGAANAVITTNGAGNFYVSGQ